MHSRKLNLYIHVGVCVNPTLCVAACTRVEEFLGMTVPKIIETLLRCSNQAKGGMML